MKVLFYGYGNPGRQDDALGIEFVKRLEEIVKMEGMSDIAFDENYQLNVEDALEISLYDEIYFVDASHNDMEDFQIHKVEASDEVNFSAHTMSPSYLAYLCKEIYGKTPDINLLEIKGYEWELKEGITPAAEQNLVNALEAVRHYLEGISGIIEIKRKGLFK